MSPLATAIYKQLRKTLRTKSSTTYRELAQAVETHHRSPTFHAALTEVTNACRAHDLPALPAIVWSAQTQAPSAGYYAAAHPRARTDAAQHAAWEREHAAVVRNAATFPRVL